MKKLVSLVLLAVLVLAGCSSNNETAEATGLSGKITVAVEESYVPFYEAAAKEYTEETGVEVEVVASGMFDVVDALATSKENSADVFMMPNDRIGDLASQKLISPLDVDLSKYTETAQTAAKYEEQNYFVPLSIETTLLIYNKDQLDKAPATLKELGADKFAAKFTDFYFYAGLLYDQGGYIFGSDNTDATDIGVASEGAVKAGEIIKSLYESGEDHWELMKDDTVAYDIMMESFAKGDVSAIINGPWAFADIEAAGVNFGFAPIPSWDGNGTYQSLTGVKGLGVNMYSKNIEAAKAFVASVNDVDSQKSWNELTQEVSPHTEVVYEEGSKGAAVIAATNNGVAMPTLPEFGKVWTPMADAAKQIAQGSDVKDSLEAAKTAIETEIAAMN